MQTAPVQTSPAESVPTETAPAPAETVSGPAEIVSAPAETVPGPAETLNVETVPSEYTTASEPILKPDDRKSKVHCKTQESKLHLHWRLKPHC